jgi:hypothetical protein
MVGGKGITEGNRNEEKFKMQIFTTCRAEEHCLLGCFHGGNNNKCLLRYCTV